MNNIAIVFVSIALTILTAGLGAPLMYSQAAIQYQEISVGEQRRSLKNLRVLLDDFETFQADYHQFSATPETLDDPEEFRGRIYWKRPSRVKLEQSMPWYELHVSDGKDYWHYDEDLEQAVRYSATALSNQFITLLIKNDLHLLNEWDLMQLEQPDDISNASSDIFVAQSKNIENQQTVNLFFVDNVPVKILVDTGLGEVLTIEFHNGEKGVKLSNRSFTFKPPSGVEVIDSANPNG